MQKNIIKIKNEKSLSIKTMEWKGIIKNRRELAIKAVRNS
jgi:hypothetical protein